MPKTPDELAAELRRQADDVDRLDGTLSTEPDPVDPAPPVDPPAPQKPAKPGRPDVVLTKEATTLTWPAQADAARFEVLDELDPDPAKRVKDVVTEPRSVRSPFTATSRPRRYAIIAVGPTGLRSQPSEAVDLPAAGGGIQVPPGGGSGNVIEGNVITRHPSDVIPEFRRWTTMLTTGTQGDPDNEFVIGRSIPGVYYVQDDGGVVFDCDPNGFHSSGSKYPRVENRMQSEKPETWNPKSAWPSSGDHRLRAVLSGDTSRLSGRKRGNLLQIHDGGDDVCQIQMREGQGLGFAHDDGKSWVSIDPSYRDGQKFTCEIIAAGNRIQVLYNGAKKVDVAKTGSGWYWKAGAYVQSGGASEFKEPAGARFKVVIYELTVTGGAS